MADNNLSNEGECRHESINNGHEQNDNNGDKMYLKILQETKLDIDEGQKKIAEAKYEEAIQHFLTAIDILQQDQPLTKLDFDKMQIFQQSIASAYHNIGLCFRKIGCLSDSVEAFSLAIDQYQIFNTSHENEETMKEKERLESCEDKLQIENNTEPCTGNEMSSSTTTSSSLLSNKPQHHKQSTGNLFPLNSDMKISETLFSLGHVYKELSKQTEANISPDDTIKHQLRHMKTALRCYKDIISILTNDISTYVHSSMFSSIALHSNGSFSTNISSFSGLDANVTIDNNFNVKMNSTNESRLSSTPSIDSSKLPLDTDRIRKRLLMLANTFIAIGDIYNEAYQIDGCYERIKKKKFFLQIVVSYENAFTIIAVIISILESDLSFQASELSSSFSLNTSHSHLKDDVNVENNRISICDHKAQYTTSIYDLKKMLANIKSNIAYHHFKNGQSDDALISYKEALHLHLEINEAYNDKDNVMNISKENGLFDSNKQKNLYSTILPIMNNIGIIHAQRNELDDASKYFERVYFERYNYYLQHENKDFHVHPDLANAINNLSNVYFKQGKLAEAVDFYTRALQIYWSNFEQYDDRFPNQGHSDPYNNNTILSGKRSILRKISGVARNIAEACSKLGDPQNALNVLKAYYEITKAAYGSDHLQVGRMAQKMGEIYSKFNMAENASLHLKTAIQIYQFNRVSIDDQMCVTIKSILNFMNAGKMESEPDIFDNSLIKNNKDGNNILSTIRETHDVADNPLNRYSNYNEDPVEQLQEYPIQARNILPNIKRVQPQLNFIYIDNHDDDSISQITYNTSDFIKQVEPEKNSETHWNVLKKLKDLATRGSTRKGRRLNTGKIQSNDQSMAIERNQLPDCANIDNCIDRSNDVESKSVNLDGEGIEFTLDGEGIEFTLEESKNFQSNQSTGQSQDTPEQLKKNLNKGNTKKPSGKENVAKPTQKPQMYILHGMVPQENNENKDEEKQNQMQNTNESETPSLKFDDLLANMKVVHSEMDPNELTKDFAEVLEKEKCSPFVSKETDDLYKKKMQERKKKKMERCKLEIRSLTNVLSSQKSKFGDHPKVAKVTMEIAAKYVEMEELNNAMHHYREALHIQRNVSSKYDVDIATTLSYIGEISFCRNEYDAALQCYREILKIKSIKLGKYDPEVGRTLNRIGEIHKNKGDYELSIDFHQHALNIFTDTLGWRNYDVYRTLGFIGTAIFRKDIKKISPQESAKTYKSRYTLLEDGSIDIKMCYRIGNAYINLSQFNKAMRIFKEISLLQGKENPETLDYIGQVYRQIGQYEKALKNHRQSLHLLKKTLKSNDHRVLWSNVLIGMTELSKGNYSKTVEMLEAVLPLFRSSSKTEIPKLGLTLQTLSDVKVKLCEYSAAMALLQEAYRIQIPNLGNDDPDTLSTKIRIGNVLAKQGKLDEALRILTDVQSRQNKIQLPDNCCIANDILHSLGNVFRLKNDLSNASLCYQKAFEMRINIYGENHPDVADTLTGIGLTYTRNRNPVRALQVYEDVLRVQLEILGPHHLDISNTLINRGFAYSQLLKYDKANYEKAITDLNEALKIIVENVGEQHILVADALVWKGKIMLQKCQYEEAKLEFTKALTMYKSLNLEKSNPKIVEVNNCLERIDHQESLWV